MIVLNFLDDRLIEPARASCLILFGVPIITFMTGRYGLVARAS